MARVNPYPVAKAKFRRSSWEIYWNWGGKRYSIFPGYYRENNRDFVMSLVGQITAALAMDNPVFPEEFENSPAVLAYLSDRYNTDQPENLKLDWLEAYKPTLQAKVGKGWYEKTIHYLKNLETHCGEFAKITPAAAQDYLSLMVTGDEEHRPHKPATHNKALSAFSAFYKWAIRTRRTRRNPFAGIKQIPEEQSSQITYCTRAERDTIIELAKATGWPDWLAIPIAFYTGMRREEICRLEWADIRFKEGIIVIDKTKTKKSRVTPLASFLEKLLAEVPRSERHGYVVHAHETQDRPYRMSNLVKRIRKDRAAQLMAELEISKPEYPFKEKNNPRSRTPAEVKKEQANYRKAKADYNKEIAKRKREIAIENERISWNPFRHTFASLLVQSGVDLDTVSAWMGNTPEVCRRHYAQFTPRDKRDDRIDNL